MAVLSQSGRALAARCLQTGKKEGGVLPFVQYSFCSPSPQVAFQHFQELDEHISYVATKVCHLGDQLEGVNTPRQRAVEAQRLMTYFNEFLDGDLRSDVFNNPDKVRNLAPLASTKRCVRVFVWARACVSTDEDPRRDTARGETEPDYEVNHPY